MRIWTATIDRERLSLLIWSGATAVSLGFMAWLEPSVIDMWDKLGMTQNLFGSDPGHTVSDQYLSFAAEIITPIVVAFVITQAAGWVADLEQARVEIVLSGPVSWSKLVRQRIVALEAGAAAIIGGGLIGLTVGATAVGAGLDPVGMTRLAVDALLLAAAFGAVAALVVAWLRTSIAVMALGVFAGASYLMVLLVQLFGWPTWITRLSLFGAFGHPYLGVPAAGGIAFLIALAIAGTLLAAGVAERSPKTS